MRPLPAFSIEPVIPSQRERPVLLREVGLLCESCGELSRAQVFGRLAARLCDDCSDRARPYYRGDRYDLGGEA